MDKEVTYGQRKVMYLIQENLGIVFRGETRAEASDFIDKYIEKSKQMAAAKRIIGDTGDINHLIDMD